MTKLIFLAKVFLQNTEKSMLKDICIDIVKLSGIKQKGFEPPLVTPNGADCLLTD